MTTQYEEDDGALKVTDSVSRTYAKQDLLDQKKIKLSIIENQQAMIASQQNDIAALDILIQKFDELNIGE